MRTAGWALLVVTAVGNLMAAASEVERPCEDIVGLLSTEFVYKAPNALLARVEIRQCDPGYSATIQLVAWRSGEATPALVINTYDFGVVQAAARANVFVVETGGATRNQVFVIAYERGEPKLVLKRVTKGTARISMDGSVVDLVIEGIYAGDAPPRTETHHFILDIHGAKPR